MLHSYTIAVALHDYLTILSTVVRLGTKVFVMNTKLHSQINFVSETKMPL